MKGKPAPLVFLLFGLALLLGPAIAACNGNSGEAEGTPTPTASESKGNGNMSQNQGVTDDRILFGQSAAFSGPAWELGTNMQLGIRSAFQEVNLAGGVNGRQLELVALDDGYEPEAAISNTFELIEKNRVFALIGAVGTPTSRSAVPVAHAADVPYVAPFTGAAFLRETKWRNVINLRASYNQETEEMVARLTEDLAIDRIAVLYQDDSFGLAGLNGATRALERRDMEPVSVGFYPRNTRAVKGAVLNLRNANPEAVIMVGAYQPVATFVAWAKRVGMEDVVFITISFVGSNALANFLGQDGENVFVTQVVPFPTDGSIPIVASYLNALEAHDPEASPGWVSLEGYLGGRLAIEALRACGRDNVTRECFYDSIDSFGDLELDEFELEFGFADNQGSDKVFLTVIGPDGSYRAIDNMREVYP